MAADDPLFIDLKALEANLANEERLRPLKRLIRRALLTQSCKADLAEARDCISALDLVPLRYLGIYRDEASTVEGALIFQAVMLYARACAGNDSRGERGSVSISAALSNQQSDDHDALVRLRNRAMAHVYADEAIVEGDQWHNEFIFSTGSVEEGFKPGALTHRIVRHGATIARLRRQLPIAEALMRRKLLDRMDELTDLLNSIETPHEAWEGALFDPEQKFGSREAVLQVLAGREAGGASFRSVEPFKPIGTNRRET